MQHPVLQYMLREGRRVLSRASASDDPARRWRLAGSAVVLGTLGAGCSLLYDLSTDQCNVSTDCDHFGAGYTCNANVCEAPLQVGFAGNGNGGSVSDGGSAGAGGNQQTGGSAGMEQAGGGGSAGEAVVPGCTSNDQCITQHGDQPFLCRAGECIDLLSDDCPFALGIDNLRSESPIIIGAYSDVTEASITDSVVTANYEFALDEFTAGAPNGGLKSGQRKLAMVVCDGLTTSTFSNSLNHLIDVVQVPAVLAPFGSADLINLFATKGEQSSTFFLSPLDADSSLIRLDDGGLVWAILGSAAQLAPAYLPLLKRTETYLRAQPAQALQPADPIRVALIDDETLAQQDISGELTGPGTSLSFNGKSLTQNNTDGNFKLLHIPSDPSSSGADAAYQDALLALVDFQPHVIVAAAGEAFVTKIMRPLEASLWDPTLPVRPFYLAGFAEAALPATHDEVTTGNSRKCSSGTTNCPLAGRILGINYESARDSALVDSYRLRFGSRYPQYPNNFENFYDSAWYMFYAVAAAGDVASLSGLDVARGMGRLIQIQADPLRQFGIGDSDPADVLATLANLGTSQGIQLNGTMGPPDFDPGNGTRRTLGSAYCMGAAGNFMYDVMRYEATPAPASMSGPPPSPPTCVPSSF